MEGLVGGRNVYLDIDRVAMALKTGQITKCGQGCMSHDAWEIAKDMVDGAVCGTREEDFCGDCTKLEEVEGNYTALRSDLEILRDDLENAIKQQDWDATGKVLTGIKLVL